MYESEKFMNEDEQIKMR